MDESAAWAGSAIMNVRHSLTYSYAHPVGQASPDITRIDYSAVFDAENDIIVHSVRHSLTCAM